MAEPLVPHGGYVEVGVGYLGVILEDAAGVGGGEAGLEVPVCVADEILAWDWALVACLTIEMWRFGKGTYRLASAVSTEALGSSIFAIW